LYIQRLPTGRQKWSRKGRLCPNLALGEEESYKGYEKKKKRKNDLLSIAEKRREQEEKEEEEVARI
jgi:hypothetical protein